MFIASFRSEVAAMLCSIYLLLKDHDASIARGWPQKPFSDKTGGLDDAEAGAVRKQLPGAPSRAKNTWEHSSDRLTKSSTCLSKIADPRSINKTQSAQDPPHTGFVVVVRVGLSPAADAIPSHAHLAPRPSATDLDRPPNHRLSTLTPLRLQTPRDRRRM
jgi:hypothetical protein